MPDVPESTKMQWEGKYYKKYPIVDETKQRLVEEIKIKIGEKRPKADGNDDKNEENKV